MTAPTPPQAGSGATPQRRPFVAIDPAINFGRPSIKGISTYAIAGLIAAGEDFAAVAEDYGLSLHEVVLACWFEGFHGEYREQWAAWTAVVQPALGGWEPLVLDEIEEPPPVADGDQGADDPPAGDRN